MLYKLDKILNKESPINILATSLKAKRKLSDHKNEEVESKKRGF